MSTPHPTYPLQDEEAKAIAEFILFSHVNEPARLRKLRDGFTARRNTEFPGWAERYSIEMGDWFEKKGNVL